MFTRLCGIAVLAAALGAGAPALAFPSSPPISGLPNIGGLIPGGVGVPNVAGQITIPVVSSLPNPVNGQPFDPTWLTDGGINTFQDSITGQKTGSGPVTSNVATSLSGEFAGQISNSSSLLTQTGGAVGGTGGGSGKGGDSVGAPGGTKTGG